MIGGAAANDDFRCLGAPIHPLSTFDYEHWQVFLLSIKFVRVYLTARTTPRRTSKLHVFSVWYTFAVLHVETIYLLYWNGVIRSLDNASNYTDH